MGVLGPQANGQPAATGMGEERLLSVLNSIDSALVLVDTEDRITALNEMAARFLGYGAGPPGTLSFAALLKQNFAPRLKDPRPLFDWLEIVRAVLDFSSSTTIESRRCEVTYRGEHDHEIIMYASPVVDGRGMRTGGLYAFTDVTELRRAQNVLEAVSLAAREINSDLQVKEIVPSLFGVVKNRVPLDGMAILSVQESGQASVLGSMPDSFLGGAGARILLPTIKPGSEILIDLISDIGKYLDSPPGERANSLLPRHCLATILEEGMASMVALPLALPDQIIGVWVLASRQPRSYSHRDRAFLEPVSGHLASAVKNATLLLTTKDMYSAAVRALAATVDIRDSYTMHHSEHVSMVAGRIAAEMGLSEDESDVIELAGLVHDIGKVGIPDSILQKPGPLGPAERSVMTNHSMLGASILERAGMLTDLAPLVLHHHEWHNGSGYPDKLDGLTIPIGASILAVADAFDTMVSDRPYRSAMSLEEAREELTRCSGAQFHPEVVRALCAILDRAAGEGEFWLKTLTGDNAVDGGRGVGYGEPRTLVEQSGDVEPAISSKELEVLFRITQEMRKLLDLTELLDHVCRIIGEEMGYSDCMIFLLDDTGEYLEARAGAGVATRELGIKIPRGQGICWWVMTNGIPQNVPDLSSDERNYGGPPGVESVLQVPLEVRGRRLGVLEVQHQVKDGFRAGDMRMLMAVAGHIASAIEVAQLHDEVKRSADSDALTGLYNRRVFFSSLEACVKHAANGGAGPLSVIIFDIDDLKAVNDRFGHQTGDEIICHVGRRLREGFRTCDVVARYGGDEFVVILPGASHESGTRRAEAVVSSWSADLVTTAAGTEIKVPSASFGVSSYPEDGEEAGSLISVADDRLREAKRTKGTR